jgi:hypothetical protein
MHEDKWKELRRLLQDARIPNKIKKQLLLEIDKITDLPK